MAKEVYVVVGEWDYGEGYDLLKAFDTEQAAQAFANGKPSPDGKWGQSCNEFDYYRVMSVWLTP